MTLGPVSVVINTINRAPFLEQALRALCLQRFRRFEVIVVNGPSTDSTPEVIASYGGRIKVGSCPVANLAISRNIGIEMAAGSIVAFLDDDAIPEPDWLQRLVEPFAAPEVGAVGGYIRDHTGYSFQCRHVVCDRTGTVVFEGEGSAAPRPTAGGAVFYSTTGANSAFRRSALADVGGFDEHYAYFLEETDLDLRLMQAGWSVQFAPEAEVLHKYAPSDLRRPDRIARRVDRSVSSKAYFCMRHMDQPLAAIESYLDRYCADLLAHYRQLNRAGAISHAELAQLESDISMGLAAGLAAAAKPFVGLRPERIDRSNNGFHPFLTQSDIASQLVRAAVLLPPQPASTVAPDDLQPLPGADETTWIIVGRGDHTTVDFRNGVWVHRVPQDITVSGSADRVRAELLRTHFRRGIDQVIAPADWLQSTGVSRFSSFDLIAQPNHP